MQVQSLGLIPGLGRSPGEGKSNPVQGSCLENPMDRGAWWTTAHGVTKSQTRLSNLAHTHVTQRVLSQHPPGLPFWGLCTVARPGPPTSLKEQLTPGGVTVVR